MHLLSFQMLTLSLWYVAKAKAVVPMNVMMVIIQVHHCLAVFCPRLCMSVQNGWWLFALATLQASLHLNAYLGSGIWVALAMDAHPFLLHFRMSI